MQISQKILQQFLKQSKPLNQLTASSLQNLQKYQAKSIDSKQIPNLHLNLFFPDQIKQGFYTQTNLFLSNQEIKSKNPRIAFKNQPPGTDIGIGSVFFLNEEIRFSILLPEKLSSTNPHLDTITKEIPGICKKYNLYSGNEIKASSFAHLPGYISDKISRSGLKNIVQIYIALFDLDDMVDAHRAPDLDELEKECKRFVEISKGNPCLDSDSGRVKAYATAITELLKEPGFSENRSIVHRTLHQYLDSILIEARVKKQFLRDKNHQPLSEPSYSKYISDRRHTSGLYHALALVVATLGLPIEKVWDEMPFASLIDASVVTGCLLNDIVSAQKEYKELQNSYKSQEVIFNSCTTNAVLLKIRSGLSPKNAVDATIQEYNDSYHAFLESKRDLGHFSYPSKEAIIDVFECFIRAHWKWIGVTLQRYIGTKLG